MKEKTFCAQLCVLSDTKARSLLILNPFLKNYVTSEGAVSHNVFYYQQLPLHVTK